MKKAFIAALVFFGLCTPASAEHAEPPLPPILQKLQGKSSHGVGLCYQEEISRPGDPPGFTDRLVEKFPIGTSEAVLVESMHQQGFGEVSKCKGDSSIRNMYFEQHVVKDGGFSEWLFSTTFPTSATVYWKVDAANNVVWVKGLILHIGP